jgi:hypothetical protein
VHTKQDVSVMKPLRTMSYVKIRRVTLSETDCSVTLGTYVMCSKGMFCVFKKHAVMSLNVSFLQDGHRKSLQNSG